MSMIYDGGEKCEVWGENIARELARDAEERFRSYVLADKGKVLSRTYMLDNDVQQFNRVRRLLGLPEWAEERLSAKA